MSELLRDSILHLCRLNTLFEGHVKVDGLIVISGQGEGEEVVVRVHERLRPKSPLSMSTPYSLPSFVSRPSADTAHLARWAELRKEEEGARGDANALKAVLRGLNSTANDNGDVTAGEPQDLRTTPRHDVAVSPSLEIDEQASLTSSISSPSNQSEEGQGQRSPPACQVCNQSFESVEMLTEHNETQHNAVTCPTCYKPFISRSNLERHIRLHTGHRPHLCTVCPKSFTRRDHLASHTARQHAFHCHSCVKSFTDRSTLASHFLTEHHSAIVNVCQVCNTAFADYPSYEEHVKIHPQFNTTDNNFNLPAPIFMLNRRLQCRNCTFIASDKLTLAKHQLIHGNQVKTAFTCLACKVTFADPLTLTSHVEQQHARETNTFECLFCHLVSPTLTSWKRHELSHVTDAEETAAPKTHNLSEQLTVHNVAKQQLHPYMPVSVPSPSPTASWIQALASISSISSREVGSAAERWRKMVASDDKVIPPAKKARYNNTTEEGRAKKLVGRKPTGNSRKQGRPQKHGLLSNGLAPTNAAASCAGVPLSPLLAISALASGNHVMRPIHPCPVTPTNNNTAVDLTSRFNDHTPPAAAAGDDVTRIPSMSSTPSKMAVDIPDGPYVCTLCNEEGAEGQGEVSQGQGEVQFDNFALYDSHCLAVHNRSPCMFCVKTFAQKANRDRHVCLHTGDKPYACPYCDERFSRGDKLKLHKTRVHLIGEASPSDQGHDYEVKVTEGVSLLLEDGDEKDAEESFTWSAATVSSSLNVHEAGEWQEQAKDTDQDGDLEIDESRSEITA